MKIVRWMGRTRLRYSALFSGLRLLLDPSRLTDVFVLEEALSDAPRARALRHRLRAHPATARALDDRRRLTPVDLARLGRLPQGTVGRAFADHMRRLGLDPAALPTRAAGDEPEYVRAHLFETHDIWHVVVGFDTDVAGELGVQAFYVAQLGGALPPWLIVGGLLNALLRAPDDLERRFEAVVRGYSLGKRARPLFGVNWDALFTESLERVRAELDLVEPAPPAQGARATRSPSPFW